MGRDVTSDSKRKRIKRESEHEAKKRLCLAQAAEAEVEAEHEQSRYESFPESFLQEPSVLMQHDSGEFHGRDCNSTDILRHGIIQSGRKSNRALIIPTATKATQTTQQVFVIRKLCFFLGAALVFIYTYFINLEVIASPLLDFKTVPKDWSNSLVKEWAHSWTDDKISAAALLVITVDDPQSIEKTSAEVETLVAGARFHEVAVSCDHHTRMIRALCRAANDNYNLFVVTDPYDCPTFLTPLYYVIDSNVPQSQRSLESACTINPTRIGIVLITAGFQSSRRFSKEAVFSTLSGNNNVHDGFYRRMNDHIFWPRKEPLDSSISMDSQD